jgi:hypothetical protein
MYYFPIGSKLTLKACSENVKVKGHGSSGVFDVDPPPALILVCCMAVSWSSDAHPDDSRPKLSLAGLRTLPVSSCVYFGTDVY